MINSDASTGKREALLLEYFLTGQKVDMIFYVAVCYHGTYIAFAVSW
jgi:hypothetical protein